MVTMARNAGNIWMINRNRRPGRRPANRNRENAYAANVESVTANSVEKPEITTEFTNHFVKSVVLNRFSKLDVEKTVGMSDVELRVPSGLNRAETTKRIGKSRNRPPPIATR